MTLTLTESQIADVIIAIHGEQVSAEQNGIDSRAKYLQPLIEEIRSQFREQCDERFPSSYAEVEYDDFENAEAIDGARFDDLNFQRYYER